MGHIATDSFFAHMPIVRSIVYGAVARGADLGDVCSQLGLNTAELSSSENRANFDVATGAWEVALVATRDPLLGLHLGEETGPMILGLVGHLMQSSATLRDAFAQVVAYNTVVTNMFHYHMVEEKERTLLYYEPLAHWRSVSPDGARQATEQAMAGTLSVFEMLSGKRINPEQATFSFQRGGLLAEYERVFRCPLRFKEDHNMLSFSRTQMATPVTSYDQSLFSVFDELLLKKSRQVREAKTITQQISDLVFIEFKGHVPPIEILASRLNMTVRSLQRRIEDEKTSYRILTSQLRMEIAQQMLKERRAKVNDVARHLGYSDASSFRRAYKAWTSTTPSKSR